MIVYLHIYQEAHSQSGRFATLAAIHEINSQAPTTWGERIQEALNQDYLVLSPGRYLLVNKHPKFAETPVHQIVEVKESSRPVYEVS